MSAGAGALFGALQSAALALGGASAAVGGALAGGSLGALLGAHALTRHARAARARVPLLGVPAWAAIGAVLGVWCGVGARARVACGVWRVACGVWRVAHSGR